MSYEFDVVVIKVIKDIQCRLLSFWRGGRGGEVLLNSEQNVEECDATKV